MGRFKSLIGFSLAIFGWQAHANKEPETGVLIAGEGILPKIEWKLEGVPKNEAELDVFLKNLKADTLPKFERVHECTRKTRLVFESYKDLKTLGYGLGRKENRLIIEADPSLGANYPYDYNYKRNFDALKVVQDKALAEIEAFNRQLKLPDNPSLNDVTTRLTKIDARVESLSQALASSTIKEDAFLAYVERSKDSLYYVMRDLEGDIKFILSDSCKDLPVSPVTFYVSNDLAQMVAGVDEMAAYIKAARNRRSNLVNYLYQYHRYKLTEAYANLRGEELTDLKNTILSVFAGGRLVEEFTVWWGSQVARGLASSLHTKYLQYEEPLRRLRALRARAESYLSKMDNIKDAPPSMKAAFKDQVNNVLRILDRNINDLVKGGWQYQFESQVLTVDAMIEISNEYNEACLPLLTRFKDMAPKVKTLEEFAGAEESFRKIVDTCVDKEGLK